MDEEEPNSCLSPLEDDFVGKGEDGLDALYEEEHRAPWQEAQQCDAREDVPRGHNVHLELQDLRQVFQDGGRAHRGG